MHLQLHFSVMFISFRVVWWCAQNSALQAPSK